MASKTALSRRRKDLLTKVETPSNEVKRDERGELEKGEMLAYE